MAGTSRDTKALVMAALKAALPDVQVVSSVPYANGDPPEPLVLVLKQVLPLELLLLLLLQELQLVHHRSYRYLHELHVHLYQLEQQL